MKETLMIIAGEASGDLHGSALVENLKLKHEDLRIVGIGGDRMKRAGMDTIYHIKDLAFLGFTEIIKHIPFIKRVQNKLLQTIKKYKIKTVVLIDYPGFNLNFAKKAKRLGVKIVYYISPQIWAWGSGRVKKIKERIDKMLVVFPFEEQFYKNAGVPVEFVGHPLIERISEHSFLSREKLLNKIGLAESDKYILLMPGSRLHEIDLMLNDMVAAAKELGSKYNLKIVIAVADNVDYDSIYKHCDKNEVTVAKDSAYDLMYHAEFGIIKSGTSTLEAAIVELPFIVTYKTGMLTYLIGRTLVKINNIAMPNIIAGENIVEELIQNRVTPKNIVKVVSSYLDNPNKLNELISKLAMVKEKLSGKANSPSEKAANIISKYIYET